MTTVRRSRRISKPKRSSKRGGANSTTNNSNSFTDGNVQTTVAGGPFSFLKKLRESLKRRSEARKTRKAEKKAAKASKKAEKKAAKASKKAEKKAAKEAKKSRK